MAGIIPLELFTTPYQSPVGMSAIPGQDIANLGHMLNDNAKFRQQQAQQARQHEDTVALGNRNASINEKYHHEQVAARKEASSERQKAAREKRISELETAYRKALMQNRMQEADQIRQEMTRLGFAVEETDTDLPEPTPPPAASAAPETVAPSAPKPVRPKKVPKVEPGFSSALDTFMKGENAKPEEPDPFGLGGAPGKEHIDAEDPQASTMPWEASGYPSPAEPQKPKRGGKFTIRDSNGGLVSTFDAPMEREKARQSVATVLEPYIGSPNSPEAKAAAERAQKAALGGLDSGMSMNEAARFGAQMYDKEMAQYRDRKLPSAGGGAGAGSGGLSRDERTRKGMAHTEAMSVIREARQEQAVTDARKAVSKSGQMEDLLSHAGEDGFTQRAALSDYLHEVIGSQQTEGELDNALGGAGASQRLLMRVNQWVNGGKMPEGIQQGLRTVIAYRRKAAQARLDDAANSTADYIKSNRGVMTDEEATNAADSARSFILGKPTKSSDPNKKKAVDDARALLKGL